MLNYLFICRIFIICTFIYNANAVTLLETCQLPLSQEFLKTFPKIKVKFLIVAVPKLGIVLHEINSNALVRCGNFSQILNSVASLAQETLNPDVDRFLEQYGRQVPKHTDIAIWDYGISISLYELCNFFEHEYLYILKNYNNKRITTNIKIFSFHSKDNIGYICRYTNINNVVFDIIIYGNYKENDMLKDIELLVKWLNRFTIKELPARVSTPIYIPVFYGKQPFICLSLPQSYELLVEKNKTKRVMKTIRYLMRVSAPVNPTDNIGSVFCRYSLFQNPVKFTIYSNSSIEKSNIFKNLADSICYIVYNRPYNMAYR